jgi:hypothetical protein
MNLFSGEDDIDGVKRQKVEHGLNGKRCRVTTATGVRFGTVTGEYVRVKFDDDDKS